MILLLLIKNSVASLGLLKTTLHATWYEALVAVDGVPNLNLCFLIYFSR